ncbi:MAG: hypothetical protein WA970_24420 [Gammaproteobacteria bacterium]
MTLAMPCQHPNPKATLGKGRHKMLPHETCASEHTDALYPLIHHHPSLQILTAGGFWRSRQSWSTNASGAAARRQSLEDSASFAIDKIDLRTRPLQVYDRGCRIIGSAARRRRRASAVSSEGEKW